MSLAGSKYYTQFMQILVSEYKILLGGTHQAHISSFESLEFELATCKEPRALEILGYV
jgi:hypothetical protein